MPRATQPSTGSTTTRAVGVVDAGPDHLVAGDEGEADDVLEVARAAAVHGGQVRAADAGQQWLHPVPLRPGQLGGLDVGEAQGPDRSRPARARRRRHHPRRGEARQVALEDEALHRAHQAGPVACGPGDRASRTCRCAASAAAPRVDASLVEAGPPPRHAVVDGAEGQRRACAAAGLVPVLDVPAPAPGDGGQAGLGVHRHREPDALEQRQVRRRVGVGHRLPEVEALAPRRSSASTRARASPVGGSCSSRPVSRPSASSPRRAHTTSSNSGRRGSTTKSRAPVMSTVRCPRAAMGPHPGEAGRERLGQQQVVEHLRRVVRAAASAGAPS